MLAKRVMGKAAFAQIQDGSDAWGGAPADVQPRIQLYVQQATLGEVYDAFTEWPWLQIDSQPCWFSYGDATYELSVSGSATYHDDTERVSIELAGTFGDGKSGDRGTLTLRRDESG